MAQVLSPAGFVQSLRLACIYATLCPLSPLQVEVRACGAVGSASAWHAEGQGFESPQVHQLSPKYPPTF
jgi:hypothetical protein